MSDVITMDFARILKLMPHRYPFLMVDRVDRLIPNEYIHAYKNVSANEPFFQGHFPGVPIMPGVLIIEALAQTSMLLVAHTIATLDDYPDKDIIYLFTGIEKARFRALVRPGDRLEMECNNVVRKLQLWRIDTKAMVDGKVVAEARLTATGMARKDF